MKKLVSLLLALCLLLAGAALADTTITKPSDSSAEPSGTTDVKLTVGETYTVTIPDEIKFSPVQSGTGYAATAEVKVSAMTIGVDKNLVVTLTNTANCGTDTTKPLYVKISENGYEKTHAYKITIDGTAYAQLDSGVTVLTCRYDATTLPTKTLSFSIADSIPVAGEYKDTLTFTVKLENISQNQQ